MTTCETCQGETVVACRLCHGAGDWSDGGVRDSDDDDVCGWCDGDGEEECPDCDARVSP